MSNAHTHAHSKTDLSLSVPVSSIISKDINNVRTFFLLQHPSTNSCFKFCFCKPFLVTNSCVCKVLLDSDDVINISI